MSIFRCPLFYRTHLEFSCLCNNEKALFGFSTTCASLNLKTLFQLRKNVCKIADNAIFVAEQFVLSKFQLCLQFAGEMFKTLRTINFVAARAFSSGVRVTEQKIKVGNVEINYVASSIDGVKTTKTLVCLPGALGICNFFF